MYKTIIVPVKCSSSDILFLSNLNHESALVWNRCVELDRNFREINGRWMRFSELQTALLGFSNLHRMGVYHVYRKYLFARTSMFQSIKAKHLNSDKVNLPFREKKYFNTGWNSQGIKVDYSAGTLSLCRAAPIQNGGKRKRNKPIVCRAKSIPQNIVEIELLYRDGLKLAIKYKESDIKHLVPSGNSAAIDLGEIHSITAIDNGGHVIIITGRKLRSIKRFRNKEVAKIKSLMRKCKKGSRRYKKLSRAIYKLHYMADNQINDTVHKTTKLFLNYCVQNNITTIYYGDLDSATRGTKGKINSHIGQKLNEWNHGRIIQQLENKLGRYGIELVKVDEAYTSQTCPVCGKRNKPTGRNYRCNCGYEQHRDIVGAMNILNTNAETELSRYTSKMYLRIA